MGELGKRSDAESCFGCWCLRVMLGGLPASCLNPGGSQTPLRGTGSLREGGSKVAPAPRSHGAPHPKKLRKAGPERASTPLPAPSRVPPPPSTISTYPGPALPPAWWSWRWRWPWRAPRARRGRGAGLGAGGNGRGLRRQPLRAPRPRPRGGAARPPAALRPGELPGAAPFAGLSHLSPVFFGCFLVVLGVPPHPHAG